MGSFGARLKQEREKKGVTLDEVALATKIGTRMLRALEEERFNLLPGGIFNKGFVRAYARQLGLDEDQAIADYLDAAGLSAPPPVPEVIDELQASESPVEEKKQSEPWTVPWGALAVVLLVIAFVFAVWGVYSREAKHDSHPPVPETPKMMESSNLAPGGSAALSGQKEGPIVSTPNLQQAASSPSLGNVKPASLSGTSASTEASPAKTPPIPKAVQVLIKARESSWLSVMADGKTVIGNNNLSASEERLIQARREIVIKAGNVGALDFWFNGVRLPLQGDNKQVKTLTFGANGLQPAAVKAQNTTPTPDTVQP